MEKLIPMMMKLQDAFNVINVRNQIELPQIVVVGSQSTGKSSVLESIVGRDFLPRGSGIVTRCPLVLQLRRIEIKDQIKAKQGASSQSSASSYIEQIARENSHESTQNSMKYVEGLEYGEFLHRKGERFYDFAKIRREIEEQTNRMAGSDKNISEEPISLTIYSPYVVDLTLVDLPGITKVPIKGQPQDIEEQIKKITYKYILQQNSLILALTAANTDLANSDALKMAREVDPDGERTIGVVTKIDLMDQGTDALELLQGKIYPLKLGYYGVKCRSQKQIDQNLSIREALINEKEFFSTHPVYMQYSDRLGVTFLSESMNKILCSHIVKCIPQLSRQINELLQSKEMDVVQLDMNSLSVEGDKGPVILNLISKFTSTYSDMIEGKFVKESAVDCLGGSRINYIFHHIFVKSVKDIDPFQYLTEQDIQTAIKNAQALSPSLFVPEVAFEVLVRQQIARLLEPSLECAHKVYKELRDIVGKIDLQEVNRFQRLKYKICDVMESVLDKCLTPTTDMIIQLIEIENAHINTNHPDFVGSADTLLNLFSGDREQAENQQPFEENKNKQFSLLNKNQNKGGQETNNQDMKKSNVNQQSMMKSSVNQSNVKSNRKSQDMEEEKQLSHQDQNQDKGGYFFGLFGGAQQQNPNSKNQQSDLAKSELLDNQDKDLEFTQKRNKMLQAQQRLKQQREEFEILQRFGAEQAHYDKSNLPPVILPTIPSKMRASQTDENPRVIMETIIIQNLIQSYFSIVKKNIADLIPKTIMAFLINESRNIAQRELVSEIYKFNNLDELLVEDPIVSQTREQRKKEIKALRMAQNLLNEVTQYKF